jgi:serine/threonine protein kinase
MNELGCFSGETRTASCEVVMLSMYKIAHISPCACEALFRSEVHGMADQGNYSGKSIGNYRILALIGSGGFGSVYRGEHAILKERVVAVKILHTHLSSPEERTRFIQEARLLEHMQHPHILQIFDVGIDIGLPYLVTEYASHGSLRDLLNRHAHTMLPVEVSISILAQVGEALSYAHQQHIIHRDLKPENILFNANDMALLADFGIATTLSTSSVKYSSIMGTPSYMAPEQFQGTLSQQGDQYALGCIAYELFTGQMPFTAPDFFAMGFKHLTDKPVAPTQLNPAVPLHIEQAILKAMAKQRGERHTDVQAFLAALHVSQYPQGSVRAHHVLGFNSVPSPLSDDDATTMPVSHLSQAATFVPIPTPNPDQQSRQYTSQQSKSTHHFDENQHGETGGIVPTQQVSPSESIWHGIPPYHPDQSQPRASGRKRIILACTCAFIAVAIIAPLFFVFLPHYLHDRTSTKAASVPLTTPSAHSISTGTAQVKVLSGQPTPPTNQPTSPITTSGSTHLPTSAPTRIPSTVSTTRVPLAPTSTAPPNQPSPPTPTPPQKTITAETFRVYFNSANLSGQEVSTQHTYSGTVSILVSGYGQASSTEYSDAFYIYTDTSGTPLSTPHTATCWVLYINGNTADSFVGLPNYNGAHTYSISMNVSQPGTINFGICDGQPTDNTGYFTVTVQQQ